MERVAGTHVPSCPSYISFSMNVGEATVSSSSSAILLMSARLSKGTPHNRRLREAGYGKFVTAVRFLNLPHQG
eukprot:1177004-Prorocentrum_minimum.AAC.4